MRKVVGATFLALFALSAVLSCNNDRFSQYSKRNSAAGPIPGQQAPDYAAVSLDGDSVRLSSFRGHPVLVNFWAMWCTPCVAELPDLVALQKEFGPRGLRFVGVSVDRRPPGQVRAFLEEHGVNWLNLTDLEGRVDRIFGWESGLPKTILLDRQGRTVVWWWTQLDTSSPRNRAYLESAVNSTEAKR